MVLETMQLGLEVKIDKMTGVRYYNLYEYVPKNRALINYRKSEEGSQYLDLLESIAMNLIQDDGSYDTIPIVKYNLETNTYEKLNNFSIEKAEQIYFNLRTEADRELLKGLKVS